MAGSDRSGHDASALAREIEKVRAGAHEFTELRLLGALRSGAVRVPQADAAEAEVSSGAFSPHATRMATIGGSCGTGVPAALGQTKRSPLHVASTIGGSAIVVQRAGSPPRRNASVILSAAGTLAS